MTDRKEGGRDRERERKKKRAFLPFISSRSPVCGMEMTIP
jgi:hypothetical protein